MIKPLYLGDCTCGCSGPPPGDGMNITCWFSHFLGGVPPLKVYPLGTTAACSTWPEHEDACDYAYSPKANDRYYREVITRRHEIHLPGVPVQSSTEDFRFTKWTDTWCDRTFTGEHFAFDKCIDPATGVTLTCEVLSSTTTHYKQEIKSYLVGTHIATYTEEYTLSELHTASDWDTECWSLYQTPWTLEKLAEIAVASPTCKKAFYSSSGVKTIEDNACIESDLYNNPKVYFKFSSTATGPYNPEFYEAIDTTHSHAGIYPWVFYGSKIVKPIGAMTPDDLAGCDIYVPSRAECYYRIKPSHGYAHKSKHYGICEDPALVLTACVNITTAVDGTIGIEREEAGEEWLEDGSC